jgi:hypothetical protein
MVALISVLSGLRSLSLQFESPQSRPDWETRRRPTEQRLLWQTFCRLQIAHTTGI